jgi:signal transduction histidine kinase
VSLRSKITLGVGLGTAVVFALALGAVHWISKLEFRALAERESVATLEILESSIATLMTSDHSDLDEILVAVAENPGVAGVRIIDRGAKVLVSSRVGEEDQRLEPLPRYDQLPGMLTGDPVIESIDPEYRKQATHYAMKAIVNRPQCHRCHEPDQAVNGYIELQLDFAPLETLLARNLKVMILILPGAMLLAVGLVWILMTRIVTRPASRLSGMMQRVADGDLDVRSPVGGDEMGHLALRFNAMTAKLGETREELTAAHRHRLGHSESMASIGRLSLAMAHEVRNPLAAISGTMQVLFTEENPHAELAQEMQEQVSRIDRALESLIAFANPERMRREELDLRELAKEALRPLGAKLTSSGIKLFLEFPDQALTVVGDRKLLVSALNNVLLNAVQSMPEGGELRLSSRPGDLATGPSWILEIRDEGGGIEAELRDSIFEPFTGKRARGTGLGLTLTRNILDRHGAGIELDNTDLGTCARLRFPAELAADRPEKVN